MNAPDPAVAKPHLIQVALGLLTPSKSHVQELRRSRFTKEDTQKLADDIKRNGLMQHPLVRSVNDGKHKYEIVAGERRWLAAKVAGLADIYVNVRELSDDQALEAQLSENLQRTDLHELEEAEGYEELIKLKKITVEQLVDIVGQSRSYIYARLKLTALCPEARKAFYSGELDASRALLIARIGHHDTQRQALKDLTKGRHGDGPMTYREAHSHIVQTYMLKLASAPFDIKDAQLLPKAGDCIKCPKRTGNQEDLFGDVKGADVCTDPKCFDDKRQAHFAIARKKLEAEGRKIIHGAEAKKLLPHWDSNHDNGWIRGDFYRLDASDYVAGRHQAIANIVGKDYVPTLLQHPGSGKFIEVVPKSTVSGKAAAKAKERQPRDNKATQGNTPQRTKTQPADAPDYKELTEQRIGELLAKKVTLDREALLLIANVESDAWGSFPDWLNKAVGLSTTGATKLSKLSEKDLGRFIVLGTFANGFSGDGGMTEERFAANLCKRHKIDPKKVESEIRAEVKRKLEADKLALKSKKAGKAKASKKSPAKKAKGKKK